MQTQHRFSLHQAILRTQNRLRLLLPLADLLMRLYIGKLFFWSGLTKLRDWEMTVSLFTDEYHVPLLSPEVAAYAATGAELVLPVLLVLGLFKQLAALGLLAVNIVAVVAYYSVLQDIPAALQDHIEWGLMLMLLACSPANLFQVDHYWGRRKTKHSI
nr:DoxX family protein [uncultured Undibacterium sp.]